MGLLIHADGVRYRLWQGKCFTENRGSGSSANAEVVLLYEKSTAKTSSRWKSRFKVGFCGTATVLGSPSLLLRLTLVHFTLWLAWYGVCMCIFEKKEQYSSRNKCTESAVLLTMNYFRISYLLAVTLIPFLLRG